MRSLHIEVLEIRNLLSVSPMLLADLNVGLADSDPRDIMAVGDVAYFSADDGSGRVLWQTDGTKVGTEEIGTATNPQHLVEFQGTVFFASGGSLWKHDGTDQVVAAGLNPSYMTVAGENLFFRGTDGTNGYELFVYDGEETRMLGNINQWRETSDHIRHLTAYNGELYFQAYTEDAGLELWKSDGITTKMVSDVYAGALSSNLDGLTVFQDRLYFGARGADRLKGLWRTDGETTEKVAQTNPTGHSYVKELTVVGDTLFFTADSSSRNRELWKFDGEVASLVKDIQIGDTGSEARYLTIFGDTLLFFANDGINGSELWKSDGSEEGTSLIQDIRVGADGSVDFPQLTVVNDTAYFIANDGVDGYELWSTDGTSATLVGNIYEGATDSEGYALTNLAGQLIFRATDGITGLELWTLGTLEPKAMAAPIVEPEPVVEPIVEPQPKPVVEPAPEPAPESTPEPTTEPEPIVVPEPIAEPIVETIAEPIAEPKEPKEPKERIMPVVSHVSREALVDEIPLLKIPELVAWLDFQTALPEPITQVKGGSGAGHYRMAVDHIHGKKAIDWFDLFMV